MQQHLQLQQLKSGGFSNDLIANFFATAPPSTNNAPNYFGAPVPSLQQQNHHFRRPIYGNGPGNENMFAAPYGNFLMNRPSPGMHFPPPLEFGNHGRGKL